MEMVEVVGKDPALQKQVTCQKCASILKYWPMERKTASYTDMGGCTESYFYISCPSCTNKVEVK